MELLFFCFYFLCLNNTSYPNTSNIYLEVAGIDEVKGQLMIAIYDNAIDFPAHDKGVYSIVENVKSKTMKIDISTLLTPHKKYAIAVYHDLNKNNKLDTNIFGAPTENYGFSNDARGFFSAPDFSEASFIAKDNQLLVINIK